MINQTKTQAVQEKTSIKKGKILKIKQGYNPNSSSLGSIVFALPSAVLAVTAVFGGVAGYLASRFIKNAENKKNEKNQQKDI